LRARRPRQPAAKTREGAPRAPAAKSAPGNSTRRGSPSGVHPCAARRRSSAGIGRPVAGLLAASIDRRTRAGTSRSPAAKSLRRESVAHGGQMGVIRRYRYAISWRPISPAGWGGERISSCERSQNAANRAAGGALLLRHRFPSYWLHSYARHKLALRPEPSAAPSRTPPDR